MLSFRYIFGVGKHMKTMLSYRIGQNTKLQTLVHLYQILTDFTNFTDSYFTV